jgi:hypothetical protein
MKTKRKYTKPSHPIIRNDNNILNVWFLNTVVSINNKGIPRDDILNKGKLNSPIHIMRSLKRKFGLSFYSSTEGKKKYYIDHKFSTILGVDSPPEKSKLMKTYENFNIGSENITDFLMQHSIHVKKDKPILNISIPSSKPKKISKEDQDILLFNKLFNQGDQGDQGDGYFYQSYGKNIFGDDDDNQKTNIVSADLPKESADLPNVNVVSNNIHTNMNIIGIDNMCIGSINNYSSNFTNHFINNQNNFINQNDFLNSISFDTSF